VAGTLVLYLICCLGVLRLRAKNIAAAGSPFVAPGGPVVPIAASALILWLLSTLALREMIAALSFVVIATLIYYVRYVKMSSRREATRRERAS
jgi:basic amino acid/polyamine antiporter, APA family